jgi:hypothetical protein
VFLSKPSLSRLFRAAGALTLTSVLSAQSFQTSFAEQKLDRSRTPVTLHGAVAVEVPTGAASVNLPLGPGIGARGAHFTPTLAMRVSPQARIRQRVIRTLLPHILWDYAYIDWLMAHPGLPDMGIDHPLEQTSFGGATLNPGTFDLALGSTDSESVYEVMGQGGATVQDGLPPGFTASDVPKLLSLFGFTGYTLGHTESPTPEPPYLRIASNDDLVLGLSNGADPEANYQANSQYNSGPPWKVPGFMAVVRGEVAFLFQYKHAMYEHIIAEGLIKPENVPLRGAHYQLIRIANRFRDSIRFTYGGDGSTYYSARWVMDSGSEEKTITEVALRLKPGAGALPATGTPCLKGGPVVSCSELEVAYTGPSSTPLPHFNLGLSYSDGTALSAPAEMPAAFKGMDGKGWDQNLNAIQPLWLTQDDPAPAQTLTFKYGTAQMISWPYGGDVAPTVLTGVDQPGGGTTLHWASYTFRLNYCPWLFNGLTLGEGIARVPSFAWGVVDASIWDAAANQSRTTVYARTVPQLNWVTSIPDDYMSPVQEQWMTTAFNTVVYHPDGTSTTHVFASPADDLSAATGAGGLQNLAFLKHVEVETIESTLGLPDRVTIHDNLALLRAGNLTGEVGKSTVPYPTRTRSWDGETGVQTLSKKWQYSPTGFGWEWAISLVGITDRPTRAPADVPFTNVAGSLPDPLYAKTVQTTLEGLPSVWLLGRASNEDSTVVADRTGANPERSLPWHAPLVTRALNPETNRLEASFTGGLHTTFGFGSEKDAGPSNATLFSTDPALTGSDGASYGYDEYGYLHQINRPTGQGATLVTRRTNDALGRGITQSGPDGLETSFAWDGAGRLARLKPPGEAAFDYDYASHPDHLGLTIGRGSAQTELRYNAFGERVLERRRAVNPIGVETWSHKIFGRDLRGRITGETIWLEGKGVETDWAKPNLVRDVAIPAESYDKCDQWGTGEDGAPVCLHYTRIIVPKVDLPLIYPGTSLQLDPRGRVVESKDAADVVTRTEYLGMSQRITVVADFPKAQVTVHDRDALGRLTKVTNLGGDTSGGPGSPKDLQTSYGYDVHGKLASVTQYGLALGLTQNRTWVTNDYGWLRKLLQPESGKTEYSRFTVQGFPQTTDYNGLAVTTSYDALGRPLQLASNGVTLQSFAYDTAPSGAGKLASSSDTGVNLAYAYNGSHGRLEQLQTTAQGQTFSQTFAYDTLGQRTGATMGEHQVAWGYDNARGVPNAAYYNSQYVASAAYHDLSWQLAGMSWATPVASFFEYGADQVHLSSITHLLKDSLGNTPTLGWSYTYDQAGRLTKAGEDQFEYDSLNRLTLARTQLVDAPGSMTQTFAYDPFGNMIQAVTSDAPPWIKAGFAFSPLDPALASNHLPVQSTTGGSSGAHYTPQGHLDQVNKWMSGPGVAMTYDPLGRVISMTDSESGMTERYQYTPEGLRTVIEEWQGAALQKVRINLYNDQRQLVSQWVME